MLYLPVGDCTVTASGAAYVLSLEPPSGECMPTLLAHPEVQVRTGDVHVI